MATSASQMRLVERLSSSEGVEIVYATSLPVRRQLRVADGRHGDELIDGKGLLALRDELAGQYRREHQEASVVSNDHSAAQHSALGGIEDS